MSLEPIIVKPGIYTEATGRTAINRYKSGLNVRFIKGLAEKIKGWGKAVASGTTFTGICRALLSWTTLSGVHYIGLGTHVKLYLYYDGSYYDITPYRDSGTLGANPFATVNGSPIVTVTHVAHGLTAGDYVHFSGATAVATLDLNGQWTVTTVIDVDTYTVTHTSNANATTTGGGAAVAYGYEISAGNADSLSGGGFGGGAWGVGTWGTARTVIEQCRTWSLVNWGEDMIACPWKGAIYVWDASVGTGTRATLITQAPAENLVVLLSEENRQLVSFGGTDPVSGVLDPMLIQWCDNEDYTNWTADITNSAGNKRLDFGDSIILALRSRGQFVIVTNKTLYTMALSGDQYIFSFKGEGDAIGGLSPNCGYDINGTVFYMGRGQFTKFTGQIDVLPCDVWSFVFTEDATQGFPGINTNQCAKVFCGRNKSRSELIWFYPSAGSSEIDRCVAYCYEPGFEAWWVGDVSFTSYLDENVLYEEPIATDTAGYIHVTETGLNADGLALSYSLETYDIEVPGSTAYSQSVFGQGQMIMRIRRVLPDFKRLSGNHKVTLTGRKEPAGKAKSKGPKRLTSKNRWLGLIMRCRQISFKIEGDEVDTDMSMGVLRLDGEAVSER